MERPTMLRIGELSRRSGVSPELLRAWERRYGLLRPARSGGGLRLYSLDDLERVRRMREHLARGLAAAEAAALAAGEPAVRGDAPALDLAALGRQLGAALESFDEPRSQAVLDELLATTSLDMALGKVIVPYLHDLGERWERDEISVAQEHFASAVLRGRLLALARGWGRGLGAAVVLACAPGEQHDLALLAFGLALRQRGWRIVYLGPDTPLASLGAAAEAASPRYVVVSAVSPARFRACRAELSELGRRQQLCLAGPGAERVKDVEGVAAYLTGSPVDEADRLTALAAA